ncbi:alpha/beta fold hydrolase [Sphingomonas paeninsulae]|nr:alpha/beta hydrolase [Sphingomonas paeninsulae]
MVWHSWGKGPPLVLLHGAHGSWMHWIRNISYLEKHFSVFAPDLPGYGGSSLPQRPDDADSFAEAIAQGIRALIHFDAPVDVVGFSLGGVLATHLAAIAPDIVGRLILVGTGGLDTPTGPMPTISYRGLSAADDIIAAHRQNLLAIMLHHPENVDPLALYLQSINIPLARVNPRPLVMPDRLLHVLPRTDVPIDAIWGEFDGPHPNPEVQHDVLKRFRPDLEFRVVKGSGHWVMYEGAEVFNRELGSLLALRH